MRKGKVRPFTLTLASALLAVVVLGQMGCAAREPRGGQFSNEGDAVSVERKPTSAAPREWPKDTKKSGDAEVPFPDAPPTQFPASPPWRAKSEPAKPGNTGAGSAARFGPGSGLVPDGRGLGTGNPKPRPEEPQVWKRDRKQPSFARVYVGDGNSLDLVSLHVTVTVEGPRARTLVDHVFRNPHNRQLEGTFEYPLPTGAGPSYFAMFLGQSRDTPPPRFAPRNNMPPLPQDALARLTPAEIAHEISAADWGRLQEARVVSQARALEVYEETVRGRIDPALLEYAGGNTFRGRVFPIAPKGYNRVLIAYEELLPISADRVSYRFGLPDCKLTELQFTLQARTQDFKEAVFRPEDAKREEGGGQVLYRKTWTDKGPGGDAVFAYLPTQPSLQVLTGNRYLYARVRPKLDGTTEKPFAENAVFLLDTSHSEHPDRFAVNMRLLRKILEGDADLKQFNILLFNVNATWLEPQGWFANTKEGREKALAKLDGLVLEGATDVSAALDVLAESGPDLKAGTPLNVFLLSDGQMTWGESNAAALVSRFESRSRYITRFHCYRTGLGAENQELFEALTRRGGGIFPCFGDADLNAAAVAHRRQCFLLERVNLTSKPVASDLLVAGTRTAIYPGGEVIVAARLGGEGKMTLQLEGTYLGKKHTMDFPIETAGSSEMAARGWGEIAVASLLALNDPHLDDLVTAYCQQFAIASRVASLLVLENEADYKRLDLEKERGKTLAEDLGAFIASKWRELGKVIPAREAFARLVQRAGPRLNSDAVPLQKLLAVLTDKEFDLPERSFGGTILRKPDVPPTYLAERDRDRTTVETYLKEARRRAEAGDAPGAVQVLSTVVEEHPGRSDAQRLVGYRLLDLKQPAQAARLFSQVQQSRPFEPHSWRDLARSLEDAGRYGLAAVQYEAVLAGNWDARFRNSVQTVARDEYARMLREALARKAVSGGVADQFRRRLGELGASQESADLRVTISWNSDATDVDLWVIEPDRFKCYYQATRSPSGGELSADLTQGYGPERYQIRKAQRGTYLVKVHYYRANQNLLGGETHVSVAVTQYAGTPQEKTERYTVILKKQNEEVDVCRVEF